jgi:hypothetical protein
MSKAKPSRIEVVEAVDGRFVQATYPDGEVVRTPVEADAKPRRKPRHPYAKAGLDRMDRTRKKRFQQLPGFSPPQLFAPTVAAWSRLCEPSPRFRPNVARLCRALDTDGRVASPAHRASITGGVMRYLLGAAVAAALVTSATSAMAYDASEVGLLECRGASQQFIVGSVTNLQCLFRPSAGGPPQAYDAQIRRFGLDIGFNQSTVLGWSVFAPNTPVPGALNGTYVGGSANATVGVGLGANVLWGGSARTIALQPVSGQAQTGLGVVGGISAMELHEHPMSRRHRHHHRHHRR